MRLITLAILIFLLSACSRTSKLSTYYENGSVSAEYTITKDSLKQGPAIIYVMDEAGKKGPILAEENYVNDKLDGDRRVYFPQGELQAIEHFKNGLYDGKYLSYYETGTLRQDGQYEHNEMTGTWVSYYPSGKPKEKVAFQNNLENGPFTEWHENGTLAAEGTYKNGDNEDGILQIYNEDGTLNRTMQCDLGVCKTIQSEN